ncbi:MAG: hypothetical protein KKD00_06740 [Gammaproteobacteria bacterium]|nr:hypothetical protein [Gammaproteobacteria bacterium]
MKRLRLFLIATLMTASVVNGAFQNPSTNVLTRASYVTSQSEFLNPAYLWMAEAEGLIGGAPSLGTGKAWYVDSGASGTASGKDWTNASLTIDAAINLAGADGAANRGDQIRIAQMHAESYTAANGFDLDVAGLTLIFEGTPGSYGTLTFADTDATVAIGATNCTIIGGRFLAGISEVVAGVIVEAAGTNFTMIGSIFPEPTTSTFEFNIAIQLTTASNNASFIGCTAFSADATGADHWLNGGAGVVSGLTVRDCIIHGEYAIAPIFSDQIDLEVYFIRNQVTQMTSGEFAIEYSAAATGMVAYNALYTDAEATALDPGSMKCIENYVTTAINASGVLVPVADVQVGSMKADTAAILIDTATTIPGTITTMQGNVTDILTDTGTTLPATLAISAAAAEPSYSHPNYFAVTADMTSATWNTAAAHEIADVTGACRLQILVETTATIVTTGTNGTMALGYAGNTSAIFSATVLDAALTGDVWTAVYGSAATTVVGGADAKSALTSALFDVVVVGGVDVGYTIATNAATTGTLTFHVWWTPLDSTGAVAAGAGGVL